MREMIDILSRRFGLSIGRLEVLTPIEGRLDIYKREKA